MYKSNLAGSSDFAVTVRKMLTYTGTKLFQVQKCNFLRKSFICNIYADYFGFC